MTKHRVIFAVLAILVFLGGEVSAQSKPWENPNSGFTTTTTTTGPSGTTTTTTKTGVDKIEPVIKTDGGSKDNGATTGSAGTGAQQSWVNGFINNTADKIKTGGVVSGSCWTWQKSWKIGADGKPQEVKEAFQEGQVGGKTNPATTQGSGGNPTPPSNPAPTSSPSPVAPPTKTVSTPSTPATPASPGTPGTPGSTGKAPPSKTASTPPGKTGTSKTTPPTTTGKEPPKTGTEIAPPVVEKAPIVLVIQDPISRKDQPFPAAVFPKALVPTQNIVAKAEPVPEDTRVKIGLDLDQNKINPQDVDLTIKDNEGEHFVPKETYNTNYRHIFRIPNPDQYTAVVTYKHPLDPNKEQKEIIHVTIPVYKMGFQNRTIDAHQTRTGASTSSGNDLSAGTTESGSSSGGDSASAGGSSGSSSSESGSSSSSSSSEGSYSGGDSGPIADDSAGRVDVSDLYVNPGDSSVSMANAAAGSGQSGHGSSASSGGSSGSSGGSAGAAGDSGTPYGSAGSSRSSNQDGNTSENIQVANADTSSSGGSGDYLPSGSGGGEGDNAGASGGHEGDSAGGAGAGGTSGEGGPNAQLPAGDGTDQTTNKDRANEYTPGEHKEKDPTKLASNGQQGGVTGAEVTTDKPYVLSISLKDNRTNLAQSFDFLTDPVPTASQVGKDSKLSFSVDLSKDVQRESVSVVIFDGKDKTESSLNALGDSFQHQFSQPTNGAFIWISGRTDKAEFSYKVLIPVVEL